MGYESKLFIVEKSGIYDDNHMFYSNVISTIDLRKNYYFNNWAREQPITDCYFYESDGNTKVVKDNYDEPLKETSLENALTVLQEAQQYDNYIMYDVAIEMLEMFVKYKKSFRNIVVLHFGH